MQSVKTDRIRDFSCSPSYTRSAIFRPVPGLGRLDGLPMACAMGYFLAPSGLSRDFLQGPFPQVCLTR